MTIPTVRVMCGEVKIGVLPNTGPSIQRQSFYMFLCQHAYWSFSLRYRLVFVTIQAKPTTGRCTTQIHSSRGTFMQYKFNIGGNQCKNWLISQKLKGEGWV
jgi:hypothetical protein